MSERDFERNAMRHTLRNALPGIALAATVLASVAGLGGALSGLAKNRATVSDSTPVIHGPDRTASTTDANRTLSALPLRFEPNQGQTAAEVDFLCRAAGGTVFTQPAAATVAIPQRSSDGAKSFRQVIRLKMVGGNNHAAAQGTSPLKAKSHYFIGSDSSRWRTHVPNFAGVRYDDVYPAIDVHYYGRDGELEYDFELAAQAKPEHIRLKFDGVQRVSLEKDGALRLAVPGGEVRQHPPVAYQREGDKKELVRVAYRLEGEDVSFDLGDYDRSRPLIIDPILTYSSYVGGSGADVARALAVDAAGGMTIAGATASANFPTAAALDATANGGSDAFVTRLSADGRTAVFSTYFGGNLADIAHGVRFDADGNLCLVGQTDSSHASLGFPRTAGAFQTTFGGATDAFVSRLSGDGATLSYSSFLGGDGIDVASGLATDGLRNVSVVGSTASSNFPTKTPLSGARNGTQDAFVARLNPALASAASLLYSTYLGGSGTEAGKAVAVDSSRNYYVTGCTKSSTFLAGPKLPYGGGSDAFVLRLNAAGASVGYFTYLGGGGNEEGTGITVQEREDGSRFAYITGWTNSADYPTLNPYSLGMGGVDAFVTKLNSNGGIFYSTYLGGSGDDYAAGIAIDPTGAVFVAGQTGSTDYPTTADRIHAARGGKDAFVTRLNLFGDQLLYSTYLGGSGDDCANAVATDGTSTAYVAGLTASGNFPIKNAVQPVFSGGTDAFFARITHLNAPSNLVAKPTVVSPDNSEAAIGTRLTWKDNSADETGFEIERKSVTSTEGFSNIATVKANTTTFVDNAVSDKTHQFVYRVRAINKTGASAYSNEARVVLPSPVTDTVARATGTSVVVVTWKDNAYNETGFEIERRVNNSLTWEQAGEALPIADEGAVGTFSDAGRTKNTTYTYRVRARNANGPSEWSDESVLTTLGAPVLTVAVGLDTTNVNLTWTDDSTTETGFEIERATPDPGNPAVPGTFSALGGSPTVSAGVTTFKDSTVGGDQTYWYRVRAINSDGGHVSDYSAQPPAVPANPVTTMKAPSGLGGGSNSATSITLNWTDNSTKEGNGVNTPGFKVERRLLPSGVFAQVGTVVTNAFVDLNGVFQNPTGGRSFTDNGVAADKSYEYRTRAFNPTGDSSYSNLTTVATRPGAPTDLVVVLVASDKARLTWKDNSVTENGFRIERRAGMGGFSQIATVSANVVTYDDAPLADLTLYTYRVRAFNAGGDSANSNEASVATNGKPTALTASAASPTQINLAWLDNSTSELGFEMERKEAGGSFAVIAELERNTTSLVDEDVELGKVYTYRVRAFNASQSPFPVGYSNEATATLTPLGAPSGLAGTPITSRRINLSWNDNSTTETGFQIQRAKQTFDAVGAPQPLVFKGLTTVGANTTRYSDLTVNDPQSPWFYRIRAVSGGSSSPWHAMGTGIITLPTPANLKATPTTVNGPEVQPGVFVPVPAVLLTWADNAIVETGYEIERRNGATGGEVTTFNAGPNATSFTDPTFSPEYVYRVRAMGIDTDRSKWSNDASPSP